MNTNRAMNTELNTEANVNTDRPYYIGMDLHKKTIAVCVKEIDGTVVNRKTITATPEAVVTWAESIGRPWIGAMEATMFSPWVHDVLKPLAAKLLVAHPAMLKAISASKKKNDRVDAEKIADLLRCNLLPECYMASSATRRLRRVLRFRNLMVRQAVRMKNKIAGLLMEVGAQYNSDKLHGKRYFYDYLERLEDVPENLKELLLLSRASLEMFQSAEKKLIRA